MIKVKTKVGDVGLVELNVDKSYSVEARLVLEQFERFRSIGKLSQLDKELEEFVDKVENILNPFQIGDDNNIYFEDYSKSYPELFKTAKESFISLIKSQYPDFDESKEYLLIKLLWKNRS